MVGAYSCAYRIARRPSGASLRLFGQTPQRSVSTLIWPDAPAERLYGIVVLSARIAALTGLPDAPAERLYLVAILTPDS
jgi:hypothetical protein